jgi:hypothetical protein
MLPVSTVYHIAGNPVAGSPYPVQEVWLITGEEFDRRFGADAAEE